MIPMNMYDPSIRKVRAPKLPKEQFLRIETIPDGLEQFETVKLITEDSLYMYPASVIVIDEKENCFWLTFDRTMTLWAV